MAEATTAKEQIFNLLRTTGVHRFPKWVVNFLPAPFQRLAIRLGAKAELVPTDELRLRYEEAIARLAKETPVLGDYVEFGVFQGTSMACMFEASNARGQPQMRLLGFDSFEGLPSDAGNEDGGVWEAGTFRSSIQYTRTYLRSKGVDMERVSLVKGWFCDTATDATAEALDLKTASIVMVDCDMYSSAKDALNFVGPRLANPAVIFFDDWYSYDLADQNMGEKRALTEFLEENPSFSVEELSEYGECGKGFLIRRAV
ncbi:MAG: TylF/MycF/NovP-related O-methyltransferase [Pseudomonadota bacterium]